MDLMNDWLMMPRMFDWADPLRRMATDALRVEEFEQDGQLVVRAEMPGIDPQKDVKASYDKGILEVHVPLAVSHPATRIPVSAH